MINNDTINEDQYLYFCDGKACDKGIECYRFGGECCHTSNIKHSMSKHLQKQFPPTKFTRLANNIYVESFDELACIYNICEKNKRFITEK